jgi:hypothetical protein
MSDEVTKLKFRMSENMMNALTTEEYEALERAQDGEIKMYRLRPVFARFVVEEDSSPMDHAKAMRLIGEVPISQIGEVVKGFMRALQGAVIPKENGSSSPLPSVPSAVEFPSQVGQPL